MNITEKQKMLLLDFMKKHPDFGRGRLRWNSENKQKLNHMWDEISVMLNSSDCGPQKKSKDWAKTWSDWKSNVLKKVAAHKAYTTGTGGGPPQVLKSTQVEDGLLEFLTPDAAGLSGIPEGGFGDEFSLAVPSSSITEIDKHSQWESIDNVDDDDPIEKIDYEDSNMKVRHSASLYSNIPTTVSSSKENAMSWINKQTKKPELTASEHCPSGRKATRKSVIRLLEEKTLFSDEYKKKMLEIKQEKMLLYKDELIEKRKHRQTVLDRLDEIKTAINEMKDVIQENLGGQYVT